MGVARDRRPGTLDDNPATTYQNAYQLHELTEEVPKINHPEQRFHIILLVHHVDAADYEERDCTEDPENILGPSCASQTSCYKLYERHKGIIIWDSL